MKPTCPCLFQRSCWPLRVSSHTHNPEAGLREAVVTQHEQLLPLGDHSQQPTRCGHQWQAPSAQLPPRGIDGEGFLQMGLFT